MTGEWPALLLGAAAPEVIRSFLSRLEVVTKEKVEPATAMTVAPVLKELQAAIDGD